MFSPTYARRVFQASQESLSVASEAEVAGEPVAPSFHLLTEDSPMTAVLNTAPLTEPAGITGVAEQPTDAKENTTSCSFLWTCLSSAASGNK